MTNIGKLRIQKDGFKAFIPNSFPLKSGFGFSQKILRKNDEAVRLLGKLDGITQLLPDIDFFLFMYIYKDATSSSQIEGTNATMMDALEAEAKIESDTPEDVDDIIHYIKALNYGMKRIENFPFVLRFIRELHKELMSSARATNHAYPGEFRKSQNWIGGTKLEDASFVPPPVDDMNRALGDLEKFINIQDDILPLIKAGLLHAQFETIHPFTDGNGRTGRMLVTFFLWKYEMLERPVLFLSSYFKKHKQTYYERLQGYHFGEVEKWMNFFLGGIIEIANESILTVQKITKTREQDRLKIQKLSTRASESASILLPKLYKTPIVTVGNVEKITGFTRAGAQKIVDRFVKMKILYPKKQPKKYAQSYVYKDYIEIFSE